MKKLILCSILLTTIGSITFAQQHPLPNKTRQLHIKKEVLDEIILNQKKAGAIEKINMTKKPPFKPSVSKKTKPAKTLKQNVATEKKQSGMRK